MIPGIKLNLGGTDYTVPPISIGSLEEIWPRLEAYSGKLTDGSLVVDALHAALRRNYPDITRETVAAGVDLANFGDVMEAVMDVGGLKRKALEAATAGEPTAA